MSFSSYSNLPWGALSCMIAHRTESLFIHSMMIESYICMLSVIASNVSLHYYDIFCVQSLWQTCVCRKIKWVKSHLNCTMSLNKYHKMFDLSTAHPDPGKRRHVSRETRSTIPTAQEEAEGFSRAGALWVGWICRFRWAEARTHDRIQRRHCRWWNWDQLCCAEYPAGTKTRTNDFMQRQVACFIGKTGAEVFPRKKNKKEADYTLLMERRTNDNLQTPQSFTCSNLMMSALALCC